MATKFQNNYYPSDGSIPAYNSVDGNLAIEILGANGRRVRLVNVDCNTTYGSFDNMTMGHSATYNGSVSIQDYIANGETDGGPVMVDADPFYLRIGGAPSSATGKFYGELQIETGIDTGEYVDMDVSGVDFSSMLTGASSEYQLVADEPPAPACFWENLVRATQQCGAPPANVAVAVADTSGGAVYWSSLAWDGTPTYEPPSLPLSYGAPATIPFLPAGATLASAIASNTASAGGVTGGGLDVTANLTINPTSISLSSTSVYAYTTGFGPRRRSVWLEFDPIDYSAELGAGFVRDNSEYIAPDGDILNDRAAAANWELVGECNVPGMVTNATVWFNSGFGSDIYLINAGTVALDNQYDGSGSQVLNAYPIQANGVTVSGVDLYFFAVSGGNVSVNPANITYDVTNLYREVHELRKIVAYLDDVTFFTTTQMADLGIYEYPPLDEGTPYGGKIAVVDGYSTYGEYMMPMGTPSENGALVGRLVDVDNPSADLGWIRLNFSGGA